MMGMLYAERLRQRNPQGTTFLSSSDVFLISIMVASKYLYDEGEEEEVYNEDWAKAGCKTVQGINKLEMDFLQLMDWNLFISKDEFSNFVNRVESRVALTNGCARGWLTYSDMCTLLNNTALLKMLLEIRQQLLENISKCLAAYMLGVSILLGSSALANLDSNQQSTMLAPTPVCPSSDCLTTEASCVFSREAIEVASYGSNQVFPPIAHRIRRGQGSFLKLQQLRNVSSPGERRVSYFYIQETLQTTKQNRTFSGLINIRPHLEDLGNLTRNLSQDLNDSVGELSIQTGSFGCVHNLNASTSISLEKVGSFRSHIVYKGCFEELLLSRESSRELKCFYGQQVCTA